MPDAMYENLKAKQAAGPEAGMMPPPAADAAMMDMGGMPIEEDMGELATEGRGGDIVMGHLTPGELIIPVAMMEDPEIARVLEDAFDAFEMDMDRFTVGHENNSINPDTGYPEFEGMNYDELWRMQIQAQQEAVKEREAYRDQAWSRQIQQQEETKRIQEEYDLTARENRAANVRAASLRHKQQEERLRKTQAETRLLAEERRTHEKVQAVKAERKRQARKKGKTHALTAATAAAAHAPNKPRGAGVAKVSRRTAPTRFYSAPGTGAGGEGGRHTAMGRRPA